jgi:hypothetical protein
LTAGGPRRDARQERATAASSDGAARSASMPSITWQSMTVTPSSLSRIAVARYCRADHRSQRPTDHVRTPCLEHPRHADPTACSILTEVTLVHGRRIPLTTCEQTGPNPTIEPVAQTPHHGAVRANPAFRERCEHASEPPKPGSSTVLRRSPPPTRYAHPAVDAASPPA